MSPREDRRSRCSTDTTWFCATCGAEDKGVLADFLRDGWPEDCCAMPALVVAVDLPVLRAAVGDVPAETAAPLEAQSVPAILSPVEHPSARPWATLRCLLAPERMDDDPDASLADHLAYRRAVAVTVARAANAVIDSIDRTDGRRHSPPPRMREGRR